MNEYWLPYGKQVPDALGRLAAMSRNEKDFCLLYCGQENDPSFRILAAIGSEDSCTAETSGQAFHTLENFLAREKTFSFGHFSYDLKNELEELRSENPDGIGFPLMHFFRPRRLAAIRADGRIETMGCRAEEQENLFNKIIPVPENHPAPVIEAATGKEEYIRHARELQAHIRRGDIYEINYCIGFYARNAAIDPPSVFTRLVQLADAPFSALYRCGNHWLICASPERFLKKSGKRIISQPIKGTRRRGSTAAEDKALAEELRNDPKEMSENVMIVDLVRNDLSRVAVRGSVKVDELFGIRSYKTVHQMVSTVSAEVREGRSATDAIAAAFPMGSMTGAPKLRAMQLAEDHENMRRGLYSGALGYFSPEGDFDFNVVIRSIQYNAGTGYLSFMAGSALTANADPEKEYEECLLKARALFEALGC